VLIDADLGPRPERAIGTCCREHGGGRMTPRRRQRLSFHLHPDHQRLSRPTTARSCFRNAEITGVRSMGVTGGDDRNGKGANDIDGILRPIPGSGLPGSRTRDEVRVGQEVESGHTATGRGPRPGTRSRRLRTARILVQPTSTIFRSCSCENPAGTWVDVIRSKRRQDTGNKFYDMARRPRRPCGGFPFPIPSMATVGKGGRGNRLVRSRGIRRLA